MKHNAASFFFTNLRLCAISQPEFRHQEILAVEKLIFHHKSICTLVSTLI